MHNHSELYDLFSHFWWLLFPLFWGLNQVLKTLLRHNRADEALALLKHYADQGKEPPPELIALLGQPDRVDDGKMRLGAGRRHGWIPVFLFGALSLGFVVMAVFPPDKDIPVAAMPFGALIMAGLCLGHLVAMKAGARNPDRTPDL
jgi:hypothetical protein